MTRSADRFLTVAEVAERLGTTERFPRRLIAERRIAFVRIGRHVRIAESVLNAYIERCTVAPIPARRTGRRIA
jgi:excisionase family DNA binding protein